MAVKTAENERKSASKGDHCWKGNYSIILQPLFFRGYVGFQVDKYYVCLNIYIYWTYIHLPNCIWFQLADPENASLSPQNLDTFDHEILANPTARGKIPVLKILDHPKIGRFDTKNWKLEIQKNSVDLIYVILISPKKFNRTFDLQNPPTQQSKIHPNTASTWRKTSPPRCLRPATSCARTSRQSREGGLARRSPRARGEKPWTCVAMGRIPSNNMNHEKKQKNGLTFHEILVV